MASIASFISYSSPLLHPCFPLTSSRPFPSLSFSNSNHTTRFTCSVNSRRNFAIFASSASPGWELSDADDNPRSKTSVLFNLIQEIEPLDVSVIQKDVPPTTIDAIKRTISGMLGLLPSDQFQVMVEALWEPLFKLLISSMMTGYTLRNAEYRLFLERNLEIHDENMDKSNSHDFHIEAKGTAIEGEEKRGSPGQKSVPTSKDTRELMYSIPDFGEMTPEAREYILKLHSSLSSVKKELRDVKRKTAALQMQQFVGEEKNDLLDYLRSLEPEKVAELSEPTSPELKDMIHSVVHGLLATLSPKMHSKGPDMGENPPKGTLDVQTEGDCIDLVENTSLQFQPLISLPRDYLARLLFWSMLLGHYVRGLEYRLELMDLMSLPCAATGNSLSDEQFV